VISPKLGNYETLMYTLLLKQKIDLMKNRKPSVAGQFYPDDPKQLKTVVETYLRIAEPRKVQR